MVADVSMLGHGRDGLLASDEEILWQGQPQGRIIWRDALSMQSVMGLAFGGFAIFWIIGARGSSPEDDAVFAFVFPLLGIPFVLIGLWLAVGRLVWDAAMRAGTHYTLTNHHAYIARHMLGRRSLESWPLAEMDGITLDDGHPGSVLFDVSAELRRERMRPNPVRPPFVTKRPVLGFRQIDDPRRVHRLITETQARLS